jgi:hypothetical protein
MVSAFLPEGFPSKVPHTQGLDPADATNAVPLVAYIQMQQLKVFGIAPGSLRHVRMDTVLNVVTAVQVEIAARRLGVDPTKLPSDEVAKTHTAEYAETPLIQSGHKMQNVRISAGDRSMAFGEVLRMMRSEGYGPAADKAERLMAQYGILPTDKLLVGFNIDADLVPAP